MSVGCKIFLLNSSKHDFSSLRDELIENDNSPCYMFKEIGELECFEPETRLHRSFVFILPFAQLKLISQIKQIFQSSKCIIVEKEPCLDHALLSNQKGADNYLPLCSQTIINTLNSLKNYRKRTNSSELNSDDFFCSMIGRSKKMKDIFSQIQQVANSSSTVLITGASGCGKELVAKAIHELSSRSKARKVSINCGAIPSDLLESELFGHVKGAFSGAINNKKGKFELADKGTLFLDEIGDMDHKLQVKLLRALQSKQIEAVGDETSRDIDTRIIAATHQNLEQLVIEKKFRQDLYYRLNVIPIELPELKNRQEDIPLLITHFIRKVAKRDGIPEISFSKNALKLLLNYEWPGNIRELENLVERLMVLKNGHFIEVVDLPNYIFSEQVAEKKELIELPDEGIDLKKYLSQIELSFIKQALDKTKGNKKQASDLLHIKRTTLVEKVKKITEQENAS